MFGRSFSLFGALAVVLCLALALPAFGYSSYPVRVSIPFDFAIDGKPMSAGQYVFEAPFGQNVLMISAPDKQRFLIQTIPVGDPANPKPPRLIFERNATGYRLAEVHLQYSPTGKRILPTKEEALYARDNGPVNRVVVALVRK